MSARRPLLPLLAGSAAVTALALSGCTAAPAQSVAAACTEARVQLSAMSSFLDGGLDGLDDPQDGDIEDVYARQLKDAATALGGEITQPDVADAYSTVKTAIVALADAIADAPAGSAEATADLDDKDDAVDAAGAALMTLCSGDDAVGGSDDATSTPQAEARRSVSGSPVATDLASYFSEPIQPDGVPRSVELTDYSIGDRRTVQVTLTRQSSSVWVPASWGRDYRLQLDLLGQTDYTGYYRFTDQSGDTYSLSVLVPIMDHTVYYNSSQPAITLITAPI